MSQKTFSCVTMSKGVIICVVCFILIALTKDTLAQELRTPAKDFSRHRIAQPTIHHGRTKREISTTRDTNGAHHPDVTMKVDIDGEDYILDLKLNEDLVTDNHVLRYQKEGKTVLHKPKREELDICQYSGTVRGRPGSSVAVSTCHGVRGVIYDGQMMRYIEPAQGHEIQSHHYIYDHSDLIKNYRCGYEGGVTNNTAYDAELLRKHQDETDRKLSRISRYKRQSDEDIQVRGPYNANKLSRYVELVLVADYAEYQANGENVHLVHHQMKDVANIINSVYSPLNIFIALVGVVVWTERDEIDISSDGDVTLNNFLLYRKTLSIDIPNDNAHLLIRRDLQNGVVGKALKGPICTYNFSGGVASNHSSVIGLVATTIAHEMGHNFGMEHDNNVDCECPDEKCIMSPSSTSVTPVHWSSCSLKSLALAFERGMDYCLRNKPKRLFDSPTCGNGFVEAGEQCDCGILKDPVCTACCHNCMLRRNATCAAGTCCDMQTCRPKAAGTVCRSADRECDLPEYCTGRSEFCPADVFRMDTTPCGNNEAYCVHGTCRTHTDQCKLLWGTTGETSPDQCYKGYNVKGTKNGNCGYDRVQTVFKPCDGIDAMCGMLHCRHLNERLEFGMETVATLSAVFINNNGTIIPCRTAIIDLGLSDVDPGLVPDGAKCGENKMCLKQRCLPVEMLREAIANKETSVCPSDCSGHGVCNSEGHCHCEPGFAPPLCALPGTGGSYDSGPATDPSVQRNFMVAMYVIFLGIIPSMLLILFLVYYSRHNVLYWWKKPKKSYVHIIPCMGKKAFDTTKSHFHMPKFPRFANSTTSMRQLLSFRNKNSINKCEKSKEFVVDEITYANIAVVIKQPTALDSVIDTGYSEIRSQLPSKSPHLIDKKPNRKICKDDIQINNTNLSHCNNSSSSVNLKPNVSPKPQIKQIPSSVRLNQSVSPSVKPKLGLSIKSDVAQFKPDISPPVNANSTVSSLFKLKPVISVKPNANTSDKSGKTKVEIINTGLASTTNEMIGNRSRVYSIRESGLYESGSKDVKVRAFKK